MPDQVITPSNAGSYQVPANSELQPKLAFATFDGSGAAGDFVPVLRFRAKNGKLLGQATGDTVTAGASVDHTWFRGLSKPGKTGIQFDTDNEGGYLEVVTHAEIPGAPFTGFYFADLSGGGIELDSFGGAGGSGTIQLKALGTTGTVVLSTASGGTIALLNAGTGLTIAKSGTDLRFTWLGGHVFLNLPTVPGPAGSLYNSGGFVKVA